MYNNYRLANLLENRRLLLLVALLFAVVFSIQYFELPYGNAFFSLFSAGKAQVASVGNFSEGNSSSSFSSAKFSGDRNLTSSAGLNSKEQTTLNGITDGNDAKKKNSVDSLDFGSDSDPEDKSSSNDFIELNHNSTVTDVGGTDNLAPEKALEDPQHVPAFDTASTKNVSVDSNATQSIALSLVENETVDTGLSTSSAAIQPSVSPPPFGAPAGMGINSRIPVVSFDPNASSVNQDAGNTFHKTEIPGFLKSDPPHTFNYCSRNSLANVNKKSESPECEVVSLSEMNDMLNWSLKNSYHSKKPQWTSGSDQELLLAKSLIGNSSSVPNEPSLHAPLFRNFSMFKRSYELMEQTLKIYIYREGEGPVFHQPELTGIYASEGWFMKLLQESKQYVTTDPTKAHLFYLPFSSQRLRETVADFHSSDKLKRDIKGSYDELKPYLSNYRDTIQARYSFWNRTSGADHFLVACHDWGPRETEIPMANCIRALCNADMSQGFQLGKDVSLPETKVHTSQFYRGGIGGKPAIQRQTLAFFAGKMHGYLRPLLLTHWENKDSDMKIFGLMRNTSYVQYMKSSKYCICPRGSEVNSPRLAEAIIYGCVPVIISDNFVPPFLEVLDWEKIAIFVLEKDIPNLKTILLSISKRRYIAMQKRVEKVRQHFEWHPSPVKYDVFHMILHSIWYNRVFQMKL